MRSGARILALFVLLGSITAHANSPTCNYLIEQRQRLESLISGSRPNLNALRDDLQGEGRSLWGERLVKAQQEILKPLVEKTQFNRVVADVIARAEKALSAKKKLDGEWTVTRVETDEYGNISDFGLLKKIGDIAYRRSKPLGTSSTILLEKTGKRILLQADLVDGQARDAEVTVVKIKSPRVVYNVRNRPMSLTEMPIELSIEEMMDLIGAEAMVPSATGPYSFWAVTTELQGLSAIAPKVDISPELKKLSDLERDFLKQAGVLHLRNTLKAIARLHEEQVHLTGKRESRFYYDDRASIRYVNQIRLPQAGLMEARRGGKLISINAYRDVRMVFDLPREQDDSIRLWIWDGRDRYWSESYAIPMNKNGNAGAGYASPSEYLETLFARFLEIKEQMEIKNQEFAND